MKIKEILEEELKTHIVTREFATKPDKRIEVKARDPKHARELAAAQDKDFHDKHYNKIRASLSWTKH